MFWFGVLVGWAATSLLLGLVLAVFAVGSREPSETAPKRL